jgi:hypothetical protein
MALNVKNMESKSKFPTPPALDAGAYPARIVQILSLGLQKQNPYKGEEKPPKQMLYVTYEMLDEFMKDEDGNDIEDKPRWVSEDFPLNPLDSDLAKSTKRYLAVDPDLDFGGDWAQLGGVPCVVNLTQSKSKKDPERIYNNVSGVSGMRAKEAAKAPELQNPPKIFDIDEPDMEVFLSLPKWLQDRIKENLEYGGSVLEKAIEALGDTDKEPEEKKKPKAKPAKEESEEEDNNDEDW